MDGYSYWLYERASPVFRNSTADDLIHTIMDRYNYYFYEVADPRVSNWFLMSSPWPVIFISIFYIYFVRHLGQQFMKNRPAFNIDGIIQIYNLIQIAYCMFLIREAYRLRTGPIITFFCEAVNYSQEAVEDARAIWYYFILKLIDLLDTVFFVLRKKNNQITFLHMYHHTLLFLAAWFNTKFVPGGHGTFVGYINCYVHIVMYAYYFVTSMWPEHKKNIWWKKYVTQIQMIQFTMICIHSAPLLVIDCPYPKIMIYIIITQNAVMFILFYNFYVNNYISKKIK